MAPPAKTAPAAKKYRSSKGETLSRAKKVGGRPTAPSSNKPRKSLPPVPAAKADDAASDEEEEVEEQDAEGGEPPKKRVKRPKKFIESQDDLLSLVASISGAVEAKTANKLKKIRKPKSETVEKEQKEERQSKKKQQLDAAKALVSAQNKAKKDRIKDDVALTNAVATAKKEGKAAAPERKRVSFA